MPVTQHSPGDAAGRALRGAGVGAGGRVGCLSQDVAFQPENLGDT